MAKTKDDKVSRALSEIEKYVGALSPQERSLIGRALRSKWGMSAEGDEDHPSR